MTEVLMTPKVETTGWLELLGMGVIKRVEQTATANIPYLSSTSLTGVAVKGVVGAYVASKDGKLARIAGGALLVDAGDAVANMVLGYTGLANIGAPTQSNDGW